MLHVEQLLFHTLMLQYGQPHVLRSALGGIHTGSTALILAAPVQHLVSLCAALLRLPDWLHFPHTVITQACMCHVGFSTAQLLPV